MRLLPLLGPLALLSLCVVACKDPETVAEAKKIRSAEDQLEDGKRFLEQGRPDLALREFKTVAAILPTDPRPQLLIARTQRELGNDGAAILALKQGVELSRSGDPGLKKQLADALRQDGHLEQALPLYVELRDEGALSDREILQLSRLQARTGDTQAAFKTLELVQRKSPDDPLAKVTEATVLLASSDEKNEAFALKILERLVTENPAMPEARTLRARHFLGLGEPEQAEAELAAVSKEDLEQPELAELNADVLSALEKFEEADSALGILLEQRPRDPELLSRLAEVKLSLGAVSTADMLVEQALGVRPKNARSLYMRGRIMEAQGELARAQEYYGQALTSDPALSAPLSRSWRIHQQQGESTEAMSTLERLLFMNKATLEEKVELAALYAESKTQQARGRKLIAEARKKDPKSDRLKEIEKKLGSGAKAKRRAPQVEIISGGRRR